MPFARKTRTELVAEYIEDIKTSLGLNEALLRFSNLNIIAKLQGAASHLMLGYLDWIAKQAVPFTATDENLEGWAALKNVFRIASENATGSITFNGVAGAIIPAGQEINRTADDTAFITLSETNFLADGDLAIEVKALEPGISANTEAGTAMQFAEGIDGVDNAGTVTTPITGGTDVESNESLFDRTMFAYQQTPHGGADVDYQRWAREVAGVTRVWINEYGAGPGTVVVYPMFDEQNTVHNGFPQGTDGGATLEPRIPTATGDQLAVADYIYGDERQPVTAEVHLDAPIADPKDFTITGLQDATQAIKDEITVAIENVFKEQGECVRKIINDATGDVTTTGSLVELSYIQVAIASIAGTTPFVITSPTANITTILGYLPTLGTITYEA